MTDRNFSTDIDTDRKGLKRIHTRGSPFAAPIAVASTPGGRALWRKSVPRGKLVAPPMF
jgi:hypothetical protein